MEDGTWSERALTRLERDLTHKRGRWNDVVRSIVRYLNNFDFPFEVTAEAIEGDVIEFLQDSVESFIDDDGFIDNSAIEDG